MVEEDKTYENEVNKSKEEPNHGGKRPGAGRPLGAKTKKMHQGHRGANHPVQHLPATRLIVVQPRAPRSIRPT